MSATWLASARTVGDVHSAVCIALDSKEATPGEAVSVVAAWARGRDRDRLYAATEDPYTDHEAGCCDYCDAWRIVQTALTRGEPS